jgi:hypothetical protein
MPSIENLFLVGILGSAGNFTALMQDDKGFGFMFSVGDSVLNGECVAVTDTSLTFKIDEYGYVRNVNFSLVKE